MQSYLTIDKGKAETVLFKMGLCLWKKGKLQNLGVYSDQIELCSIFVQ